MIRQPVQDHRPGLSGVAKIRLGLPVSESVVAEQHTGAGLGNAAISRDGRYTVFGNNEEPEGVSPLRLYNRDSGSTRVISGPPLAGTTGFDWFTVGISDNGRYVVYTGRRRRTTRPGRGGCTATTPALGRPPSWCPDSWAGRRIDRRSRRVRGVLANCWAQR
jgi:hypothetical protein